MPIKKYGVWKGTPTQWDGRAKPDHGHMTFTDGSGKDIDVAVNVESRSSDARLVYWLLRDFDKSHPIAQKIAALQQGFYAQNSHSASGLGLDFLRGNFLNINDGVLLSHDAPGEAHDILEYLDPILNKAVQDQADIYLFGQRYDDPDGTSGIHDIHMNQGNAGNWEKDNGIYQDGGIVLKFPDDHWEGIFLAFAVQASQTDDRGDPAGPMFADLSSGSTAPAPDTGDGTGAGTGAGAGSGESAPAPAPAPPTDDTGAPSGDSSGITIQAALVNPIGPDDHPTQGAGETVYLLNRSSAPVSVGGWTLTNSAGQSQQLPGDAQVGPNSKKGFVVPDCALSNKGGEIVLQDASGNQVDSASWTKAQAQKEGVLVYFKARK